ncbi:MAG: SDR family NAD(P)-dependent oxidoreductase [Bacteroidales bacterium]|nr:SDR family NAD(P)-dependent oxidoreductase [Bacteroidales bacterium]MDD4669695.1 SDR family NAD(P)-dependent oxidoreductase [Bacteroidales bacterium]
MKQEQKDSTIHTLSADEVTDNTKGYALVTGASSGMGREYARELYALGHNLIIVARKSEDIDNVRDELLSSDGSKTDVISIALDLALPQSSDILYEQVADKRIDILINNAGVFEYGDVVRTDIDDLSRMLILHNYTLTRLCRHFVLPMKERGYGYILNISSLTCWMPYPGLAMYSATKRFNKSFSRSLRVELKGSGVSVTTAYFGAVSTNLFPLSDKLRNIAINTGIMITAKKAAHRALKAMFHKRANVMPGAINYVAIPFLVILPNWFLNFLDKKVLARFKFC